MSEEIQEDAFLDSSINLGLIFHKYLDRFRFFSVTCALHSYAPCWCIISFPHLFKDVWDREGLLYSCDNDGGLGIGLGSWRWSDATAAFPFVFFDQKVVVLA